MRRTSRVLILGWLLGGILGAVVSLLLLRRFASKGRGEFLKEIVKLSGAVWGFLAEIMEWARPGKNSLGHP